MKPRLNPYQASPELMKSPFALEAAIPPTQTLKRLR
jgi:hypothetical protein